MNERLPILSFFAALGAMIAKIAKWDSYLALLLFLMVADYVTGTVCAALGKSNKTSSGYLSSRAGLVGIVRKVGIIVIVFASCLIDQALADDFARPLCVMFFIGNEGLSLLENFGSLGVPYPGFLKKILDVFKEKGEGDIDDNPR